jgi:hypothetical protein
MPSSMENRSLENSEMRNCTVWYGDTMSGIATCSGMSLNSLIAANPQISNHNMIFPEQNIPMSSGSSSSK